MNMHIYKNINRKKLMDAALISLATFLLVALSAGTGKFIDNQTYYYLPIREPVKKQPDILNLPIIKPDTRPETKPETLSVNTNANQSTKNEKPLEALDSFYKISITFFIFSLALSSMFLGFRMVKHYTRTY